MYLYISGVQAISHKLKAEPCMPELFVMGICGQTGLDIFESGDKC
jgi:hypothetical protein